jgi:hypothetical protein
MQRLLALFETFFGANSIFIPDAGREEYNPERGSGVDWRAIGA